LALVGVVGREALDELAGDPDDDLARPETGHLLGFLERDRAVVDDRRDVDDRPRRHVAQALALPTDTANRAVTVLPDLEDEGLRELRADVERGAGGERLEFVALPEPPEGGHRLPRACVPGPDHGGGGR